MFSNETRDEIERRALEITAIIEAKRGPFMAEIMPECPARWHVITTVASMEGLAAKHLAERGFGVYIPTFERSWISRGCKRTARASLFPGHIFLFVWDVLEHWRRIRVCPGVMNILAIDERPVVVDDGTIDRMQGIEFNGEFNTVNLSVRKPKRARRRRERTTEDADGHGSDTITISTKSYWAGIEKLDERGRISVLHKALGLAS